MSECPMCGAAVTVVTGGEGTSHYQPIDGTSYLLTWEGGYGDEEEGCAHVAVYRSQADAKFASLTLKPPHGFSARGYYVVTAVPLVAASSP